MCIFSLSISSSKSRNYIRIIECDLTIFMNEFFMTSLARKVERAKAKIGHIKEEVLNHDSGQASNNHQICNFNFYVKPRHCTTRAAYPVAGYRLIQNQIGNRSILV